MIDKKEARRELVKQVDAFLKTKDSWECVEQVLEEFRVSVNTQVEEIEALSDKDVTLIRMLNQGRSYAEIASALFLGRNTIRNYVQTLYQKTHVGSRYELATKYSHIR